MTPDATKSVLAVGDSILESGSPGAVRQITLPDYAANTGTFAQRALVAAGVAHVDAGYWASRVDIRGRGHIPKDISHYTHMLMEWGYNDLNTVHAERPTGDAAANALIVMQNIIDTAAGYKTAVPSLSIAITSPTVQSTSTDGWTTLNGQTPSDAKAERAAYRSWQRDGMPILAGKAAPGTSDTNAVRVGHAGHPIAAFLDVARATMNASAPDDERFRVDKGPLTADGGHPNAIGHELMRAAVDEWAARIVDGTV